MRSSRVRHRGWVVVGTLAVISCGGGNADNQSATASRTPAPPAAGAAESAGAAAAAATGQPITGKTWDVRMLGDANGYRFDPATLTIKAGDGVRWTMVSGGPHNVTFWPDSIPPAARQVLQASMPQPMSPLTGPLLSQPSQTYTISFGGAPKGVYHYYCTPHLAMGMKGTITVQ